MSDSVMAYLVGRPNAGKTSLQMALTGVDGAPVNFPGSSVERNEASGELPDGRALTVVDLPGLGSFDTLTPDERLTAGFIDHQRGAAFSSAVMLVVLDATKLGVELRFLQEAATLGVAMVVAVNKTDATTQLDLDPLRRHLGEVPVVATSSRRRQGIDALLAALSSGGAIAPSDGWVELDIDTLAASVAEPKADRWTHRLDALVLHRFFGLPLLGLVFVAVFQCIFLGAEPFMGWIESAQGALTGWVEGLLDPGALRSFLNDGLIAGFGAVVIFVPQIALLMVLIALMEASGYMARAAFLLDRPLTKVGLNGRSFLPLMSAFGCAVPAIAATRIIENERDRIATLVVAPLMSCSARLPVYVILIGAFFEPSAAGLVLFALYSLGIVVAALVAWALRRTALRGSASPLLLELPAYQRPQPKVVFRKAWSSVQAFLTLAGTLIFGASVVIWLLSYYPRPESIHARFEVERARVTANDSSREATLASLEDQERAAYLEQSYLARAGKAVTPLFAPAGFEWRTTVGVLAAFPARELIVPTLGILYGLGDVDPGTYEPDWLDDGQAQASDGLRTALRRAQRADGTPAFDTAVALALMVFFALCSQCVATLGAIRRETRSWKWPVFTFVYMTSLAWIGAVVTYQLVAA